MSLCNHEASVVCLSVCLSVRPSVCKLCTNRYFYHRNGWIATKLAHDGPHKSPHPECLSVCLSVNFFAQIATSTTNMTLSLPNLHTMVPRRACIQDVLKVKVKVKGHVIRALFCLH